MKRSETHPSFDCYVAQMVGQVLTWQCDLQTQLRKKRKEEFTAEDAEVRKGKKKRKI